MLKIFNYFLFVLVLFVTLPIFSCEKNNIKTEKKVNDDSIIENMEFTGTDNQKQTFKLKAKKGLINKNNTVELQDIKLDLFRNNSILYSIFSKNGTYLKSENLIKLNDNIAYLNAGNLKFKSANLQFDEKTKVIQAKKVSIFYSKNKINGSIMRINRDFNRLNLKKVNAKFQF